MVILLAGHEVLIFRAGVIEQYTGLPGIPVGETLAAVEIRDAVLHTPDKQSGTSWRGPHIEFKYRGEKQALELNVSETEAQRLIDLIEQSARSPALENADTGVPEVVASAAPTAPQAPTEVAQAGPPPTLSSPSTLALIAGERCCNGVARFQ